MNPKDHPNAYAGGLSGAAAAILLHELDRRLGVKLDAQEASFVSVAVAAAFLFAGRQLSRRKGKSPTPAPPQA